MHHHVPGWVYDILAHQQAVLPVQLLVTWGVDLDRDGQELDTDLREVLDRDVFYWAGVLVGYGWSRAVERMCCHSVWVGADVICFSIRPGLRPCCRPVGRAVRALHPCG